jgi:ribulose-phosphate 3-epimerase
LDFYDFPSARDNNTTILACVVRGFYTTLLVPSAEIQYYGEYILVAASTKKQMRPEFPEVARGRGVHIAPSILSADFADLKNSLLTVKKAGCRWIHLDIMDGHFVPNLTMGPVVVQSIRSVSKQLFFDVHLMITDPRDYIKAFVEAGAQLITFHYEAAGDDSLNLLKYIHRQGIQAGISIKPRTPVEKIEPLIHLTDLVLIMSVEPGFGGQKLIPHTMNKVRELVHLREKKSLSYLIQVDGGIGPETAPLAVAAGSDVLVAGSSIFKGGVGKIRGNVKALKNSLATIR